MIKTVLDANTNKLHDEFINAGITPLLVESKDNETYITLEENTNMTLMQQIIDAHDSTPLPELPTEKERIDMLENMILMMMEV